MARTVIAEADIDSGRGHVSLKRNDERYRYRYTVETKHDERSVSPQSHTDGLGNALDLFKAHLESAGVELEEGSKEGISTLY